MTQSPELAVNQIGLAQPTVAAIDNGGTNTRIDIRVGQETKHSESYATPHEYEVAVSRIGSTIAELTSGEGVQAVGFAVAGAVDEEKIISAGELQEYGWVGRPFKQDIAAATDVDAENIVLMNDCEAAAKAQQVANRQAGLFLNGYIATISTGFGGASFSPETLTTDEPGHEFLKPGATCGCGKEGCVEAHISGSGIERKYGIPAEVLDRVAWKEVINDTVEAHIQMINRLTAAGHGPAIMHYFGSVAMKGPGVLSGLQAGLTERRLELDILPVIAMATHGDNSGLVGAGDAAIERLS